MNRESPYAEFGISSEKDWEGVQLFTNEPVYEYATNESRQLIRQELNVFIMDFVKTLPHEELIDTLEVLSEEKLIECLGLRDTFAE